MAEFATSIDVDAEPALVFRFLTTSDGMTAWMGQWADLDPEPGWPVRGRHLRESGQR